MPIGIEIFDETGALQFDAGNRLILTLADVALGTSNGSITVPGITTGTALVQVSETNNYTPPAITVSGETVSWNHGSTPNIHRGGRLTVMVY